MYTLNDGIFGPYNIQPVERQTQPVKLGAKDGLVGLLDSGRNLLSIPFERGMPIRLHNADFWDIARLMYLGSGAKTPLEDFASRNRQEIERARQDVKDGLQLSLFQQL